MGLLKNLYFDFSIITGPFKRKKAGGSVFNKELPHLADGLMHSLMDDPKEDVLSLPQIGHQLNVDKASKLPQTDSLPKMGTVLPSISSISSPPPITTPERSVISTTAQENSFFAGLLNHLDAEQKYLNSYPKDVAHKNMMDEMRSFWEEKKLLFDKDVRNVGLEDKTRSHIIELRNLEVEWQALQVRHEKTVDELGTKEKEIEARVSALKSLMLKMSYETQVPQGREFFTYSGQRLSNIKQLKDQLFVMDNDSFHHHVNDHKNDFSSWIRDVMGLSKLADEMWVLRNRNEIISLLERYYS